MRLLLLALLFLIGCENEKSHSFVIKECDTLVWSLRGLEIIPKGSCLNTIHDNTK